MSLYISSNSTIEKSAAKVKMPRARRRHTRAWGDKRHTVQYLCRQAKARLGLSTTMGRARVQVR